MLRILLLFFLAAVVSIVISAGVGAVAGSIVWVFCTLLEVSKNDTANAALGVGGAIAGFSLIALAIVAGVWLMEHAK